MKVNHPLTQELRFAHVPSGARIAWASNGHGPVMVRAAHWMTHVEHDPRSPLWRPWLEGLGRTLRLVRYDERGCGSSASDGSAPGLDSAVQDLAAVVKASGAERVALLGISGAAPTAVAYAERHPERVSHLVLLGGYLCGLLHRRPTPAQLAFLEARVQLMRHGWGRGDPAVQQFFTTTMLPDATPEQAAALNEQQRLSCDGSRAADYLQARAALDVRELAPRVTCPTLVLHAEGDAMVPIELGRELAAAIPGARFEALATRNHIPTAGSAAFERFTQAVSQFVNAAPPGPALTPRERELAALVAQGLDNLQIGARLGLADKTVRNALSLLYGKLGVEGRPQAVVRTRDLGL
jgi:pimeloyl-ACP methyl ester carboxylesterase